MSVNIFGYGSQAAMGEKGQRGTPGIGFKYLDESYNFDIGFKRLANVAYPLNDGDAVTKYYHDYSFNISATKLENINSDLDILQKHTAKSISDALTLYNKKFDVTNNMMIDMIAETDHVKNTIQEVRNENTTVNNNISEISSELDHVKNTIQELRNENTTVNNNISEISSELDHVKNYSEVLKESLHEETERRNETSVIVLMSIQHLLTKLQEQVEQITVEQTTFNLKNVQMNDRLDLLADRSPPRSRGGSHRSSKYW
jgi:chromosome segregation ATPase